MQQVKIAPRFTTDTQPLFVNVTFDTTNNKPQQVLLEGALFQIATFAQVNETVTMLFETNAIEYGIIKIDVIVQKYNSDLEVLKSTTIGNFYSKDFISGRFVLNYKFKKDQKCGRNHHVLGLVFRMYYEKDKWQDIPGMIFRLFSKSDNITSVKTHPAEYWMNALYRIQCPEYLSVRPYCAYQGTSGIPSRKSRIRKPRRKMRKKKINVFNANTTNYCNG